MKYLIRRSGSWLEEHDIEQVVEIEADNENDALNKVAWEEYGDDDLRIISGGDQYDWLDIPNDHMGSKEFSIVPDPKPIQDIFGEPSE